MIHLLSQWVFGSGILERIHEIWIVLPTFFKPMEQRSKWVGRKRSYFWGQLWSVILEVTKPVMLKEACLSFHIQDMIMGLRVRTERIQSNVQVSEGWCQDCISWAMLPWVHGWRYCSLEVGDWFSWLSRIPSSVGVPDSAWLGGEEVTCDDSDSFLLHHMIVIEMATQDSIKVKISIIDNRPLFEVVM